MFLDNSTPLTLLPEVILENQDSTPEVALCPIMIADRQGKPSKCLACDIPQSREKYLVKHFDCHKGRHCLPRKKTPKTVDRERFGSKKPKLKAKRYGNGYAEPILDGKCVVCEAGKWRLCYLEYGDDPAIKSLIRSDYVGIINYDEIARRLMKQALLAKKGPR